MSIMVMATLELNSPDLLAEWKVLSDAITADLQGVDGFISRDSVQAENGLIYCILKWESKAHQEAFMASLMMRPDAATLMADFSKVVNITTMSKEFFTLI